MKFKNNNSTPINKLTIRILKADKIRNIFAIFSIILTTILFTSLFTIGGGIIKSQEYTTMRQTGGSAHATFKYLDYEKLEKLKKHPLIKKYGYSIMLTNAENIEFAKIHTEIRYAQDEEAKMYFSYPEAGTMPKAEDEIATDTRVLDLLKVPHKIGENVTIKYSLGGKEYTKDLKLCGFWESDDISPASMMWVSKEFVEDELSENNLNMNESGHAGLINLDVMFSNSLGIGEKVSDVITESGYSTSEGDDNYIASGVNWSYVTTNFDNIAEMAVPMLILSLLVVFTGYLIIYNIFQISVVKDIKLYGLLKTIGTTKKQIKKLIRKQAFMLCIIGIPIGLLIGFFIGKSILPIILSTTNIDKISISINPLIFIGSAIFSLITVYISCMKPGKIASEVSPVEAAKYCEVITQTKNTNRKSSNGSKLYKMALYNLQRNKKKTLIVIISMSLSIVLFNSIYTFTNSFNMDKYISKNIVTDFVAANANYFNVHKHFRDENDIISETMIDNIKSSQEFKDGGRLYYSTISNENNDAIQLYGFDKFPISKLEVLEGNLDEEKLKTGNYIIYTIRPNDNGKYNIDKAEFSVGDKVTVDYKNKPKTYEVLAIAGMNYSFSVRYFILKGDNFAPHMVLPSEEFCKSVDNPLTMSYVYDVKDGTLGKAETHINEYTNSIEKNMNYQSKQTFVKEFEDFKNMFNLCGGTLAFIIGLIGVLNFINSILTSIISRKHEFAIMQSIGMTNKQLRKMLMFEGIYYVIITTVVSSILSVIGSISLLKSISKEFWFCEYVFTIKPLVIITPCLLIFAILIPIISYKSINKLTIIERLREVE